MPALEVVDFIHYAVLWRFTGRDRYAKPVVADPIEIRCRWLNKRREVQAAQGGNTIAIDATVYVAVDIPVGSLMWFGRVVDLLGTDQIPPQDVMQVILFDPVPDLKGRNIRRMASLMKYTDALP